MEILNLLTVDNIDQKTRIDEHFNAKQIGFWGRIFEILCFNRTKKFNKVIEKATRIFENSVLIESSDLDPNKMAQIIKKLSRAKQLQGKNLPERIWQEKLGRMNKAIEKRGEFEVFLKFRKNEGKIFEAKGFVISISENKLITIKKSSLCSKKYWLQLNKDGIKAFTMDCTPVGFELESIDELAALLKGSNPDKEDKKFVELMESVPEEKIATIEEGGENGDFFDEFFVWEFFRDPVITPQKHIYDRKDIVSYLKEHEECPNRNELSDDQLNPQDPEVLGKLADLKKRMLVWAKS